MPVIAYTAAVSELAGCCPGIDTRVLTKKIRENGTLLGKVLLKFESAVLRLLFYSIRKFYSAMCVCLQTSPLTSGGVLGFFDTVGWASGRASGL